MRPTLGRVVLVKTWHDGVAQPEEVGLIVVVHGERDIDVHVLGHNARVVYATLADIDGTLDRGGRAYDGTTWSWPPRV